MHTILLLKNSEGKKPLGRPRCRWEDNTGCGRETGDYKNKNNSDTVFT
jgi:hypothetical protein